MIITLKVEGALNGHLIDPEFFRLRVFLCSGWTVCRGAKDGNERVFEYIDNNQFTI